MCLIDQKNIISTAPLRKEAFKMCVRVKHIIIVTDHCINPGGNIQRKLKRTYHKLLGLSLYRRPIHFISTDKHIINCIIYAIKVTFCIRARFRIA